MAQYNNEYKMLYKPNMDVERKEDVRSWQQLAWVVGHIRVVKRILNRNI